MRADSPRGLVPLLCAAALLAGNLTLATAAQARDPQPHATGQGAQAAPAINDRTGRPVDSSDQQASETPVTGLIPLAKRWPMPAGDQWT